MLLATVLASCCARPPDPAATRASAAALDPAVPAPPASADAGLPEAPPPEVPGTLEEQVESALLRLCSTAPGLSGVTRVHMSATMLVLYRRGSDSPTGELRPLAPALRDESSNYSIGRLTAAPRATSASDVVCRSEGQTIVRRSRSKTILDEARPDSSLSPSSQREAGRAIAAAQRVATHYLYDQGGEAAALYISRREEELVVHAIAFDDPCFFAD